jgi:hypothetical protein
MTYSYASFKNQDKSYKWYCINEQGKVSIVVSPLEHTLEQVTDQYSASFETPRQTPG